MITHDRRGDVAVLTLAREERRNALDVEHGDALREAIDEAAADGSRAVVITGAGTSFCSGADFGEVYTDGFREALYGTLYALAELPVPVIAAVNGPAIGAGTQLAIACDLRVAAPTATFAVPTARIGLAVNPWTVQRLVRVAGGAAARAILLGCDTLDAPTAHARGLVDRLGSLDDALAWADEIAALAPLTLAYSKRALDGAGTDEEVAAAFEACWTSEDVAEGQRARAEKRSPRFEGRPGAGGGEY